MDSVKFQYLPQSEMKAYQEKKLAETLEYVNTRSPYYKELFAKENIDISKIKHIEDLQQIPVTTKQDLQLRNMDFLCVPETEILDYVTTSGTLGDPVTFADTENDLAQSVFVSQYHRNNFRLLVDDFNLFPVGTLVEHIDRFA